MIALRQQGVATEPLWQGEGRTEELILDGKPLWVLKGGRPVNFDPERLFSVPTELIQHTRGLMLIGALQALRAKKPGVVPLAHGARFARAQTSLIELMKKRWEALNLPPLRAPTPQPAPRPEPPAPALGTLSAEDELQATIGRFAQFRVSLGVSPPSAEQCAKVDALNAVRNAWYAYLARLPVVVPRDQGSIELSHCVYRDEAGVLNHVWLGHGPGAFHPVPIEGVEGEPVRLVRHSGTGFFEMVTQVAGGLRSHFFQQPRIDEPLRPIATHPAGRALVHDKRLFVIDDDGAALSCTALGAARRHASIQVPPGAGARLWIRSAQHGLYSVYGAESSRGFSRLTAFSDRSTIFRVTDEPPTICGLAGDLETHTAIPLDRWMRRCRTAFPMGNEWMIMDGEANDGRGILLAVHVPSGQVCGAQHDADEEVDYMASQKPGSSNSGWLGIVRKRDGARVDSNKRTLELKLL